MRISRRAVSRRFVDEKMAFRDGHAASFIPRSAQERFIVPDSPSLPKADFTIEAFIMLRSVYADAKVRTIVSQWDGNKGHPGWSLGVTGMTSRNKPQTLVLSSRAINHGRRSDPIEPVFLGMHIDLNKPYFIAVSVDLDDADREGNHLLREGSLERRRAAQGDQCSAYRD
jgi:hypothetical protein